MERYTEEGILITWDYPWYTNRRLCILLIPDRHLWASLGRLYKGCQWHLPHYKPLWRYPYELFGTFNLAGSIMIPVLRTGGATWQWRHNLHYLYIQSENDFSPIRKMKSVLRRVSCQVNDLQCSTSSVAYYNNLQLPGGSAMVYAVTQLQAGPM